ncbi:hypothetical protein [Paenibacillus larvae]|uniref:hypothetical protein n=1 Tax=Paenibacillus larvae TaxID=1464 RepID=UPI000CE9786F|nr:hypothetical protein [Paenibacillus larvae]AVG12663.1 hypothetical protein ERICII_02296 [Paenibacillus larvae subsp. larvae DSM 25430]MDR5569324.1 hypothetical protein [Paenibacillus larvae]MDR5596390.1 hypothetical protein [Paenibacillus larvae]
MNISIFIIRKKLAKNNQLIKEPLDGGNELPFEEPSALKQAIEALVNHKIKTKQAVVNEICLPYEEIEVFANLEPGYLLQNENDTAKIIQINFKR